MTSVISLPVPAVLAGVAFAALILVGLLCSLCSALERSGERWRGHRPPPDRPPLSGPWHPPAPGRSRPSGPDPRF